MILSPVSALGNALVPTVANPAFVPALQQPTGAGAPAALLSNSMSAMPTATAAAAALAAAHQQNPYAAAVAAAGLSPAANGLITPAASYFEGLPIYLFPNPVAAAATQFILPKVHDIPVSLTSPPAAQSRIDTSKHFNIFVGDLSSEIDNKALKEAFAPFGEISEVKVIRDLQTLKSKGYGFVTFVKRDDAERAIEQMNGQWLGRRTIRTNWASRKTGAQSASGSCTNVARERERERNRDRANGSDQTKDDQANDDCGPPPARRRQIKNLTYDEIMSHASPANSTVYVGGISAAVSDDDLKQSFGRYGTIIETRVFRQQGYAFVKFDQKESAAKAILNVNNTEINGCHIRCSWGKEGGGSALLNYNLAYTLPTVSGSGLNNIWSHYYQYYSNPTQWQAYWQQQQQQQQVNAATGLLMNSASTQ